MTEEDHTDAVRGMGFPGWKATIHRHPEATGFVGVMTSPDFNPVTHAGRVVTARGKDPADAFARVLETAKGSLQ